MDFQPTQQTVSCGSDINGDGTVSVTDLLMVIDSWSPSGNCCPGCPGDVDGDLVVDVSDVLQLVGNWGSCP
ncbi:MAG: dockerin type I domain-containing protein, partial [Phycisphaerales bacterium]|nr:dockerin type I domain-containing protein [Phycisphaerales bacterium]